MQKLDPISKPTVYKEVRLLMRIIEIMLAIIFVGLNLDLSSLKPMFTVECSNIFFQLMLFLYFTAWCVGPVIDMKYEEYIFSLYPNNNKLKKGAFATIFSTVILFVILYCLKETIYFAIVLTIFFVFNIFSWRYLVSNYLKSTLVENENMTKGTFEFEYHRLIENYLIGKWQKYRFACGFFILIIFNVLIYTDLISYLDNELNVSTKIITSICFSFFVLIMEGWIWIIRLKRKIKVGVYDEFKENYKIELKSNEK